ncbi:hypothetical protein B0H63DRAFT_485040 [Podospora didyma]|uniref:Uncharacterized protein n=1 Tax=Podospora didyma TaxID=330526 RepID=A0AAE0K9D9_9PEZI|nr:hypothetical protein B0H63DRAFT_485040 [Podospora didyma]
MGNLCGKESDPFAQPGRRLDSAVTPAISSGSIGVPASTAAAYRTKRSSPKVGGPARTLGGGGSSSSTPSSPNTAGGGGSGSAEDDARRRAAAAAEVFLSFFLSTLLAKTLFVQVVNMRRTHTNIKARANQAKRGGGKLQAKLDKQKAQPRVGTLRDLSETEQQYRAMDQTAKALQND